MNFKQINFISGKRTWVFREQYVYTRYKVSVEFWAIYSKLSGNCEFPQNFYTSNLGEFSVFHAVDTGSCVGLHIFLVF